MTKSVVALVHCDSYQEENVYQAVKTGISLIGGTEAFARQAEKILLKPNLLAPDPPERATTTHPSVFKAVARVFQEVGIDLSYGDSPSISPPISVAGISGIAPAAEELGIPLVDFEDGQETVFHEGKQNQKFLIANGVLQSDGLISLPKLKTHNLTRLTGAIKNQFGCIPGAEKKRFHIRLPGTSGFSRMLADLNLGVKPRLSIMDGILGMEGSGPRGGDPIKLNVLLFSADPVALDATVSRLAGADPFTIPPVRWGAAHGLGRMSEDEIELVGDQLARFTPARFDLPVSRLDNILAFLGPGVGIAQSVVLPRLSVDPSHCTKCGICVKSCPLDPPAVQFKKGNKSVPPSHDLNRCIRCYCCQENCPEKAIRIHPTLLSNLFNWGYGLIERSKLPSE